MVRRPCLLQSARARVVEHEVISVDIVARLISPPTLIISVCVPVKGKKSTVKFVIDCTQPVEDKVLDVASFEKYLHDRIKIGNKTGALNSNNVQIVRDRTKLTITAPSDLKFPKRQLKYLSKRYLKKQQLRDYLRVVAASKMTYELRYFSISAADDEEEEE